MKLEDKLLAYEDQQMTVGNDMDGALLIRDARELIESLRAVARAASGMFKAEFDDVSLSGPKELHDAVVATKQAFDAVPGWVLEANDG